MLRINLSGLDVHPLAICDWLETQDGEKILSDRGIDDFLSGAEIRK
ncbi:MAG: hypothetical protein KME16_00890 [Scytolyngbya sp. HA4215-MV1]|jgi:hypothetical protein|nr:hypothetical protein [Scytolyngbya sp. HA4215-MV1]